MSANLFLTSRLQTISVTLSNDLTLTGAKTPKESEETRQKKVIKDSILQALYWSLSTGFLWVKANIKRDGISRSGKFFSCAVDKITRLGTEYCTHRKWPHKLQSEECLMRKCLCHQTHFKKKISNSMVASKFSDFASRYQYYPSLKFQMPIVVPRRYLLNDVQKSREKVALIIREQLSLRRSIDPQRH